MMQKTNTNGGAYIADSVQSEGAFVGRDQFNLIVPPETYLHQIWGRLDADLQDALSLAYNQVSREGENELSLVHLVKALARLHPELREELVQMLMLYPEGCPTIHSSEGIRMKSKSVDLDQTLQDTFAWLLARNDRERRLNCGDLLKAFGGGPEHPFPGLMEGDTLGQRIVDPAKLGYYPNNSHVVARDQWFDHNTRPWITMFAHIAKARWN